MPVKKKKIDDDMKIYLSTGQKNQIKRMADLSNKSISEYVRDAALSLTLDSAKTEFYQSINENFLELKRSNYVLTRMILLLGTEVMKDEDSVIQFYKEIVAEAENRFLKE